MQKRDPNQLWRNRYHSQKRSAKRRGIAFQLTFDEWLAIWRASGHLAERGRTRGLYVMSRIADIGGYKVGNVMILSKERNSQDINMRRTREFRNTASFGRRKEKPLAYRRALTRRKVLYGRT